MSAKERAYGVRHGAYVHCFNQPERDYSVRHGAYVRRFNQSERDYSIRHGVCTYAVQQIRAQLWRTSRNIRTLF